MNKLLRVLVICSIGFAFETSSIAWAQTYTTVDFPGAVGTILVGGPNPQGTSVGTYSSDNFSSTAHGFTLTSKGVFTSFDPPGSVFTIPASISPQGVIVGAYFDSGGVEHGFVLANGQYTTVDYPSAAGTMIAGMNPSGGNRRSSLCHHVRLYQWHIPQFHIVEERPVHEFRPAGGNQQQCEHGDPLRCDRRWLHG